MSHQHYALCGAFDRHNYGDILFPLLHGHVIHQQLGVHADVGYYAVKAADLTDIGGLASESMRTLYERARQTPERYQVVFCGGDILSADWVTMLGHHLPSDLMCRALSASRRVMGFQRTNEWLRYTCRQPSEFPYVMNPAESVAGIHYTGVGASGFNADDNPWHLRAVATLLGGADTLSVRDQSAVDQFAKVGVTARLVPDTALVMSDIYSTETLDRLSWRDRIETRHGFDIDHYVVFQAARAYLANEQEKVARQLAELHARTGLSVLLLPIGRATGHSDAQVLSALFGKLDTQGTPCAFQHSSHVLHIMASLAFSSGYIGTSLHGAISAYAFGHKVCGIATQRVRKLHAFLDTWLKPTDAVSVADTAFLEPFTQLVASGTALEGDEELADQKAMVYADMRRYLPEATDGA